MSYRDNVINMARHNTNAEIEEKVAVLENALTGESLEKSKAVQKNPRASQIFDRYAVLLKKLSRDDALFSGSLNRYALKSAEIEELYVMQENLRNQIQKLEKSKNMNWNEYQALVKSYENIVKSTNAIANVLLAIEKELCLTVASTSKCKLNIKNNTNKPDLSKYMLDPKYMEDDDDN